MTGIRLEPDPAFDRDTTPVEPAGFDPKRQPIAALRLPDVPTWLMPWR